MPRDIIIKDSLFCLFGGFVETARPTNSVLLPKYNFGPGNLLNSFNLCFFICNLEMTLT